MNLNILNQLVMPYTYKKMLSNAELLYARHKLRAGKCHFRSARKRAMNEQLNDGN